MFSNYSFSFLVAGHGSCITFLDQIHWLIHNYSIETTAHTLAFILGHLALFPDIQEKLYDETRSVWPGEQSRRMYVID